MICHAAHPASLVGGWGKFFLSEGLDQCQFIFHCYFWPPLGHVLIFASPWHRESHMALRWAVIRVLAKKQFFSFFFFFSLHYFFFSLLNTKAIIHLPNILIPHPSTSSLNLQSMSLHVNNSQRFLFFPKQIYSISAARTINPEDSWMLWNQNLKWVQWKFVTLCQLTLWIVLWVIQVQLPPQLLFFFFFKFLIACSFLCLHFQPGWPMWPHQLLPTGQYYTFTSTWMVNIFSLDL